MQVSSRFFFGFVLVLFFSFSSRYKVGTIAAHMSHTASFVSRTAVPLLQKQTIYPGGSLDKNSL